MLGRPVAAGFLAVVFASAMLSGPADAATRAVRGVGRVVKAFGLTINGKPAESGALVRPGDRLKTTSGGKADVVLADGAIFRLYPGSEATLPQIGRKRTLVQLVAGAIMSIVGRPMAYRVKAPKAVAAVGGTCFYMQATPDAPNYACVCSGLLHIGPVGGALTPVESGFNHHTGMMVESLGFKPAGAKNHDDLQMWELGKELEEATGIPNKYKSLGAADPNAVPVSPPDTPTAPPPDAPTAAPPDAPAAPPPGAPAVPPPNAPTVPPPGSIPQPGN